jgi:hypothetical protein
MNPVPEYRRAIRVPPKQVNRTSPEHADELLKRWRETGWVLGIYHPIKRSESTSKAA